MPKVNISQTSGGVLQHSVNANLDTHGSQGRVTHRGDATAWIGETIVNLDHLEWAACHQQSPHSETQCANLVRNLVRIDLLIWMHDLLVNF